MEDLTARIVERRERELDQQLADSLGESLENVINLPQIEKANLMNVMHINVDISVDAVDEGRDFLARFCPFSVSTMRNYSEQNFLH